MNNNAQIITRSSLSNREAAFLSRVAIQPVFTSNEARVHLAGVLDQRQAIQLVDNLVAKGWLARLGRGLYAAIPLSSGESGSPQLHEFVIAMELVKPAAIAYWSALSHQGMTEQLPGTVFLATNHPVRHPVKESVGLTFKIVTVRPHKFFGVTTSWVGEQPIRITDREKTIVDGLDLPQHVGGVGEIAKALGHNWDSLNEERLVEYAGRMGNSAVAKRLGYLMESLRIGHPEDLRRSVRLAPGYVVLDPTLPHGGHYSRRWGLRINTGSTG